ncbi:hypothetical protein B0H13DRAFT_2318258 [Mycena leptocephala]|nr:hypothetical protein B0H13DRAFT_2318258 [Mycena leptocephala]
MISMRFFARRRLLRRRRPVLRVPQNIKNSAASIRNIAVSSNASSGSASAAGASASAIAGTALSPCALACITVIANTTECGILSNITCACTNADFQFKAGSCLQPECHVPGQRNGRHSRVTGAAVWCWCVPFRFATFFALILFSCPIVRYSRTIPSALAIIARLHSFLSRARTLSYQLLFHLVPLTSRSSTPARVRMRLLSHLHFFSPSPSLFIFSSLPLIFISFLITDTLNSINALPASLSTTALPAATPITPSNSAGDISGSPSDRELVGRGFCFGETRRGNVLWFVGGRNAYGDTVCRPSTKRRTRNYLSRSSTQPLLSMTSQPSLPFSFNQVQSAAPARSMPSLVPQDYQPVYPDFSQRGNADTFGSEQPRGDEFARMVARLRPDELAQLNEILVDTSDSRHDPQHYINLNLEGGTFNNNHYSGITDELGLLGRDDGLDRGHSPTDDDLPRIPGILLNPMAAQAMMKADSTKMLKVHLRQVTVIIKGSPFSVFDSQVEMHDVDVRKKHKKRKHQDSDVDDSPSRSEPAKKKRKKRANRRQASRGIREFTGDRRRIIEKAYLFLQKALAIHIPWPVASKSGDPSADDDEFQILFADAWAEAIGFLELDPEDFNEISLDESNLICSRISQFRGCIMAGADKLVRTGYGFIDIQSLDDPTPKNIAEAQETNRQLVSCSSCPSRPNQLS